MSGGATGGVQNYKGVMLCNRPADDAPPTVNPAVEAPRFRPGGLASEPIGLNPAKENLVSNMLAVEAEAARRRAEDPERLAPDTVMTKHKRWLAEMARKKAALNAELAESAARAAANRKVFEAYSKTLRQAVRERTVELAEAGVPHLRPKMVVAADGTRVRDPDPALSPPANPAAAPVAAAAAAPAVPSSRPPSSSGGGASKKKKKAPPKPKWAMTETEADDVEEEEAAALVDFASGLDYDKYMDDLEVKQALTVIRERIDKQKAAEAAMNTAAEAEAEAEEELAIALGEAGDDWRTKFLQSWNEASEAGDDDDAAERASVVSSTTSIRRKAAAAAAEGAQPGRLTLTLTLTLGLGLALALALTLTLTRRAARVGLLHQRRRGAGEATVGGAGGGGRADAVQPQAGEQALAPLPRLGGGPGHG